MTYVTGYNAQVRTLSELFAWSQWQGLDPEYQRRALRLMDDSIIAGHPVGIGGTIRTIQQQTYLFISRHGQVSVGAPHCSTYNGKYYQLHTGMAHAAPPGLSYHEPVTKAGKCLAVDFIGDMAWLDNNCEKYGITWIKPEEWHGQPHEIPHSRGFYVVATMDPLKSFALPGAKPTPAPIRVYAPVATMQVNAGTAAGMKQANVKAFQLLCNMWGWHDAFNRDLVVDGMYQARTAQACMSMQRALKLAVDGQYGPVSQVALQKFLDAMVKLAK
jgi:hypothetical protein